MLASYCLVGLSDIDSLSALEQIILETIKWGFLKSNYVFFWFFYKKLEIETCTREREEKEGEKSVIQSFDP